jgi:hypothetical protein
MDIKAAAREFGIAELRLHQLIRQHAISFRADDYGVYVEQSEVQAWLTSHPEQWQQWMDALQHTQDHLISNRYLEQHRNLKDFERK